jgi:hypothetical protein
MFGICTKLFIFPLLIATTPFIVAFCLFFLKILSVTPSKYISIRKLLPFLRLTFSYLPSVIEGEFPFLGLLYLG